MLVCLDYWGIKERRPFTAIAANMSGKYLEEP